MFIVFDIKERKYFDRLEILCVTVILIELTLAVLGCITIALKLELKAIILSVLSSIKSLIFYFIVRKISALS